MKIKYIALFSLLLTNSLTVARFHDHIDMTIDAVTPVLDAVLPPPAKLLSKPAIWALKIGLKWMQFEAKYPGTAQVLSVSTKAIGSAVGVKAVEKTATSIVEACTPGEKEKEGKLTESEAKKVKVIVSLMDKAAK